MDIGARIAAEALALVGTPFRLRGRDVRTGIDCVGLALLAFGRAGVPVVEPPAYQMRGTSRERAEAILRSGQLVPVKTQRPGDLVLVESGPMQLHLMIRADEGASRGHVHAHAGLGRVVLMPPSPSSPIIGIWRACLQTQASD